MNRKEFLNLYPNIKETDLINKFKRIKEQFIKKGLILEKTGRGENTEYKVEKWYNREYPTILQSNNKVKIDSLYTSLNEEEYLAFLGIVASNDGHTYRGTIKDFLEFILLSPTPQNIEKYTKALKELEKEKIIFNIKDTTYVKDGILLTLTTYSNLKVNSSIEFQILNYLNKLKEKYNKKIIEYL